MPGNVRFKKKQVANLIFMVIKYFSQKDLIIKNKKHFVWKFEEMILPMRFKTFG